ncbi:MAG TPA: hypothetical protein VMX75_02105, partial [Spirochaetia bacterium]|nr:hypothetical protein [Spirochaetia bacterium]
IPEERTRFEAFAQDLFHEIESKASPPRRYQPLAYHLDAFSPSAPLNRISTQGKRVVVLTDSRPEQTNLLRMIERFQDAFEGEVEVHNLYDVDIKGGCLGCLRCGFNNRCAYSGKDGFIDFYNSTVREADIIVFAGAIVDRQLSWKWRQFFDRSFFNCHTPSISGKQVAFLVSGPLSQLPELRIVYEAWMEIQNSNLVAFLSDEAGNGLELEKSLDSLAKRLIRLAGTGYIRPQTFLGKAGLKVFRDDIWGGLRVVFRADHKAYKRLGIYDFPQKRIGRRILVRLAWLITGLPGIREKFPSMIKDKMVQPYKKILQKS